MIMRVYALAGLLAYLPAVHSTTNSVVAAAAAMEGGRQAGRVGGGREGGEAAAAAFIDFGELSVTARRADVATKDESEEACC